MTLAQLTAPHAEQPAFGTPAIKRLFDEMVSTYGRSSNAEVMGRGGLNVHKLGFFGGWATGLVGRKAMRNI
jgi:hypothetical protein